MSREAMLEARELIKAKRYDEARFILHSIDHPTAQEWLAKLDQIAPVSTTPDDNPFDNPFDSPFVSSPSSADNPFAASPKRQPPPSSPPRQPESVWVNDATFAKPAKKKQSELSNGTMILVIGGMLVVAAFALLIVFLVFGGDDKSADRDAAPTSIVSFNDEVFELDLLNQGELRYGDIRDDYVANDTGHVWTFQGVQGDHVDIAIQSEWDNVLQLKDASGNIITENDDQSGGEFAGDARLYDITLPATGTYQVVVRPWGFIGGTYRLWLSQLQ